MKSKQPKEVHPFLNIRLWYHIAERRLSIIQAGAKTPHSHGQDLVKTVKSTAQIAQFCQEMIDKALHQASIDIPANVFGASSEYSRNVLRGVICESCPGSWDVDNFGRDGNLYEASGKESSGINSFEEYIVKNPGG